MWAVKHLLSRNNDLTRIIWLSRHKRPAAHDLYWFQYMMLDSICLIGVVAWVSVYLLSALFHNLFDSGKSNTKKVKVNWFEKLTRNNYHRRYEDLYQSSKINFFFQQLQCHLQIETLKLLKMIWSYRPS